MPENFGLAHAADEASAADPNHQNRSGRVAKMVDYEKLGVFYLGRPYDPESGVPGAGSFLYESKDLTTHGVCVGMTGSGKTGLCMALLEEAAIDGIPAIVIDPKGDMANLLLAFPSLAATDFLPWTDADEVKRKGLTPAEYAQNEADRWREGLAQWNQDGARIRRMLDGAEFAFYTPGSTSGRPLSILQTFASPLPMPPVDQETLRETAAGMAASLLALVGENTDPVQSRAHILLSHLFLHGWSQGMALDLAGLIQMIQQPPMSQIGVMDLEAFYPTSDRVNLALKMNNLLASPTFAAWREGEPLDISRMLHTPDGRPRISIVSIAHLGDSERMFFVSLLLNQMVAWMRTQSGTSSLRAILYMDEIHGFFPPVANPPSKTPMLTLLRQARAYGLGVMLTTQNPVDLDYKGLSNAGTWFIGRLQTERDRARVLAGLEGVSSAQGARFDRARIERILAGLGSRIFYMHNVHDEQPTVFESRWCMTYLRGPLTRADFEKLRELRPELWAMDPQNATARVESSAQATGQSFIGSAIDVQPGPGGLSRDPGTADPPTRTGHTATAAPLPSGIQPLYFPLRGHADGPFVYRPALAGVADIGFRDNTAGIQTSRTVLAVTLLRDGPLPANWDEAKLQAFGVEELDAQPRPEIPYARLPDEAAAAKNYTVWARDFADWIYRTQALVLYKAPLLKAVSQPEESEGDFRARIRLQAREQRDAKMEELRKKYATRVSALEERIRKAQQAVEREKDQAKQQKVQTAISFGATLLSSFLGSSKISATSVGKATTTMRGASQAIKKTGDVARSQETVAALNAQLSELEEAFQKETEALAANWDPQQQTLTEATIRPLKQNIRVRLLTLAWLPFRMPDPRGEKPAWE